MGLALPKYRISGLVFLLIILFIFGCTAGQTVVVTATPSPTEPPTAPPTSTPLYTEEEQDAIVEWCAEFKEIYYSQDEVRADIQVWLDSQGQSVTQNDIDMTREFAERFADLYMQSGDLSRLPKVRHINDSLGEGLFTEQQAYESLYRAYAGGTQEDFDRYVQFKREAELSTTETIDLFNDTMLELDISPATCEELD